MKSLNSQKGIALITTLLIVSLLVVVIIEFNKTAIADIEIAKNFNDEKKILYMVLSGVNVISEYLELDEDFTENDNLLEEWAQAGKYFDDASAVIKPGLLEGRIIDENGKINVNSLVNMDDQFDETQKSVWARLLSQPGFDLTEYEINTIIHSVKDWLDSDDEISGIHGAENVDYREAGHKCKNNYLDTLEELLLIKGITEEVFYGNKEKKGIKDCFTVYGDGLININTAPLPVLEALSEHITEDIAIEMDRYRRDEANITELNKKKWYMKAYQIPAPLPEKMLSTKSDHFSIYIKCVLGESTKTVRTVASRTEGGLNILYWQEF